MAYSTVINPFSPVKLVQRMIGPDGPRGFGIIAKPACPSIQSKLSVIIPHHCQRQGTEERVFFGPLRFVNHLCKGYNIVVSQLRPVLNITLLNTKCSSLQLTI